MAPDNWGSGELMSTRLDFGTRLAAVLLLLAGQAAHAQMTDQTQTPNAEGAGIFKSLDEQIGAGVGDWQTPDSSSFITARDPARAIRRGGQRVSGQTMGEGE